MLGNKIEAFTNAEDKMNTSMYAYYTGNPLNLYKINTLAITFKQMNYKVAVFFFGL